MDQDDPRSGGVVAVYSLPSNIGMFDMTAAIDPDLSDGARGLLWRILALHERHIRIHGLSNPFRIWQKELVNGAPGGVTVVRAYLRELSQCGYVRRWKEQDDAGQFRWVTEAAPIRAFDGNELRADIVQVAVTAPKPKRKRTAKTDKPKPPKPAAKPGYHDLLTWLQSPDGGNYIVPGPEFPRVGKSINSIIEIAIGHGWLRIDEVEDPNDVATDDMIFYVSECWKWIKSDKYKGNLDIHNVAAKLNTWWNTEGRTKFEGAAMDVYTPTGPSW